MSGLLVAAMVGSAIGGGAIGTVATSHLLAPRATQTVMTTPALALQAAGQTKQVPQADNVAGRVYSAVGPAVVRIDTTTTTGRGGVLSGSGSGIVVDARGYILTNEHVVDGSQTVKVIFSTGTMVTGQVAGTDTGDDLAIVKVALPANTPVATLGNSDQTQVGDTAIAIGTPFGLDETVTQGIISAVHRDYQSGNSPIQRNLLQTDAPINPGNSGGPLLNAQGEVIGINTMIESPIRGSVGVGFAIPSNTAKNLIPQLETGAQLQRAWLGIQGMDLDATIAKAQGLSVQSGVLVTAVVPNGPAAQAGLQGSPDQSAQNSLPGAQGQNGQDPSGNAQIPTGGDVITRVDSTTITNMKQLAGYVAGHKSGDTLTLTILRNGKEQQIKVTLQAWPATTNNG
ncbi:MAG: trypsin-like peptidase domain-containing protein [Herpetosiphonaceae bacterium]|nr:trypsin-like peptidase domain-containing protein [Herpetosiphonaceae bacterium]